MFHRMISIPIDGRSYDIAAVWREAGDDFLVFLHGLGCSADSFQGVLLRPDFLKFSILAIDLPGFGCSSQPEQFSYSIEDHARICAEVLARFKVKRLHVVAHSMGGAVGLLLPQKILDAVSSFANLEGNLISEDCGIVSRRAVSVPFRKFQAELWPKLMGEFCKGDKQYMFLDSASPFAFYRSAKSLVEWSDSGDLLKRFLALPCRKAYFYENENSSHPAIARLRGIDKIEIAGGGHFLMNDNPDDFYTELRRFINCKF